MNLFASTPPSVLPTGAETPNTTYSFRTKWTAARAFVLV